MFRAVATALVLFVLASVAAEARPLKGRLFLGRDLHIFIEEDESLVTDLLRSIALVQSEVPVMNLTAAALRPDQLAIGKDRKLYAADPAGGWVEVGEADDVSCLKLAEGVSLELARDVVGTFAGDTAERLAVRWPEGARRVAEPPLATFADWLAELDRQACEVVSSKAQPAPYVFLFNALAGSLPGTSASPQASERYRTLKGWIERGPFTQAKPLEQLLKRVKKDVQVRLVGGKASGENTGDAGRLMQAYEALETALQAR
jgi:hypothetical protein